MPGISVLGSAGQLRPEVREIAGLVAAAGAILATGHLTAPEVLAVAAVAAETGLARLVVTHPESVITRLPLDVQRDLARRGALFERCYVSHLGAGAPTLDETVAAIRATGIAQNVLSTDFGQAENPPPVAGMAAFLDALTARGFTEAELHQMAGTTPAWLLGLD